MEKLEIKAVIKKGNSWRLHRNLWKEPPYSTVNKNWHQSLREGERAEDDGRSGHPKNATADEYANVMHTLVMSDRSRDMQTITSKVGISFGAVKLILTNILGKSKVLAKLVPWMLTDDHKRTLLGISRYLLSRYENDPGNLIERAHCGYVW